jgi:penicillin-binding protein 1C
VTELVLSGSAPRETCAMHQRIAIDVATGLRATGATPVERVAERVFTIVPPEGLEWARIQGIAQPPPELVAEAANTGSGAGAPALVMTAPDQGAAYQIDRTLPRQAQRIVVAARPGVGTVLSQLTLYVDGRPLATFLVPPYQTYWTLEPGNHAFWAEALDGQGQGLRSASVSLEVIE